MKKKNKKPEELGNWMDTYGDMVTLLLCFFVLLYSISTVDQQKWKLIVESFNPSAVNSDERVVIGANVKEDNGETTGNTPPEATDIDETFDDIYITLVNMVEELGIKDAVEMTKTDDYTFISFRDKVFFNGDSSVLTEIGKNTLDVFGKVLGEGNAAIKEIQVMGHTSQADPLHPNNIRNDRTLSSQRSAEVIIFLQSQGLIEPGKLVGISFGQFRPIDTFETTEGRARNRRVELIILKAGGSEESIGEYYDGIEHQ